MNWHGLIEIPWAIFVVYWALSALKTRRTVRREGFAGRYGLVFIEVIGFFFVFDTRTGFGVLGQQFMAPSELTWKVGVALTWVGIGIAVWARYNLGEFWSGRVTLKEDHQLIRTGPYARLRHPIYSGLDLAVIGGALVIGRWRCVLGVALVILGFALKAKREERLLSAQFGAAFGEHKKHTGFLLPRF
jgi:protein-S-isoprenylcysteine O-methyltransferase Ste14